MQAVWRVLLVALTAIGLVALIGPAQAQPQPRAALVIGNNVHARLPTLKNAVNDSVAVASELRKSGFKVAELRDASRDAIEGGLKTFLQSIANGGVGLLYFSGHGLQIEGRSFLAPADYAAREASPAEGLIPISRVLDSIDAAKPKLVVIILDACRDDPFPAASAARLATRGLSEVARPVPAGALVLYAASSNQSALDGLPGDRSGHGLFTGVLLDTLRQGELEIRDVAHRVRYAVMQKARSVGHRQIPAVYENLAAGEFYLDQRQSLQARPAPPSTVLPAQIKLLLPFAAGGPSDALVRSTVLMLAKELGREVLVENSIDVQGDRVTGMLASGPKDGSLLLVSPFAAAARRLRAGDRRLAPVAMLFDTPLSIAVSARSPARSLGDLLDEARRANRKLVMQVAQPPGSPTDICGQQAAQKLSAGRIDVVRVNGEALAVQSALTGAADLICMSTLAFRSMAAQPGFGLKELAEVRWSATPSTDALRVQAAGPQGYDIMAPNWLAVFAAADVKAEVVHAVAAAIGRLQRNPDFVKAAKRAHGLPVSADQATPSGLLNALNLGAALQDAN